MAIDKDLRLHLLSTAAVLALAAAPAAAQDAGEGNGPDEILVVGIRGSLSRAADAKRDAATIIDSVSAEELGRFPDRNVAESLGNIPGISVRRTRGAEGQFVTVRGLGQGFSVVTLNDRILPTDNAGREFAFDVLPSEMISGADVFKAVEARNIEGSIGGGINLRSARPFDYEGFTAFGSVEGEYNDLSDKFGKKATAVVSGQFNDEFGALASVSWSDRKLRTDNLREYFIVAQTEADTGVDFTGDGAIEADGPAYVFPEFYSPGVVLGDRERFGASAALQWKPSDGFDLTIDGLYTNYNTSTKNFAQSNFIESSRFRPGSVSVDENNVVTDFIIDGLVAEVLTFEEPREVDTYLFGANAEWRAGDRLTVSADGYWGEATRNSAGKERFFVAGIIDAVGVFRAADPLPEFEITIPGGRTIDQATNDDYRAHFLGIFGDDLKDEVIGGKIDAVYELDNPSVRAFRIGFQVTDRSKVSNRVENVDTSCSFCGYPFTFGAIGADIIRPFPVGPILQTVGGNFPRFFATFDNDAYLAALPAAENNPAIINPETGLPYPVGFATQVVADIPVQSFDISEQIYAAYIQTDFEFNRWSGNIGLRFIRTSVLSKGAIDQIISITKQPNQTANFDVVRSPATPIEGGGDYFRALPSLNLAYDLADDMRVRFAAAQVISRPSLDQLSPASSDNAETGDFTQFNFGNPNLQPVKANQFDLSWEWYPTKNSLFAAALFYKDIKNFITTGIDSAVIAGQDFTVITVTNGDTGSVKGLELTGQYAFENGFGVAANVTVTDSKATFGAIKGELEDVTPFSLNIKAFYEKGPISGQVTYNYDDGRTSQLDGFVEGLSVFAGKYEDLTFSASYTFADRLTLFVEGSNLLNETLRQYNTFRNVPALYEENGRSFFFGVRARF